MERRPRKRVKRNRKPLFTAATADKHELYERSVQDTSVDIAFMNRVFKKARGRLPLSLREDFCGTAKLCADWVRRRPERTAYGLDLHEPTLRYGRRKHVEPLGRDAERVHLLCRDVLDGLDTRVDVAVAYNFSYCVFKERPQMLRYFQAVRRGLVPEGVFFLDIHGGPDAQIEVEECTKLKGFTYVWDQLPMDALSACAMRYIHFRFPDGTSLERAFSYDWRIWTLPELRDLLSEAGFARVDVYWEGANDDGTGNGVFRRVARAENEDSWVAYIAAWRE